MESSFSATTPCSTSARVMWITTPTRLISSRGRGMTPPGRGRRVGNRTGTSLLATGMTNFSSFVIGEPIPPAPTITTQPQNQTAYVGDDVQFSVDAAGTGILTYQWYLNGIPIAGKTNSTLVITNVQATDAGT